MSIHNNLRQLRLYSGMTQEQAAGKLGVARQTLSSYESGRTRPDIDMLVRLCGIYETDLDGMIYGQNRTLKAVQRVKKTAVRILILLIGLTLVSSSLLWSANHFFPVAEGWLTSAEQAVFESHRRLTGAWEAADKTILALSLLGFAALLMFMLTGKCVVPLKQKILYMMVLAAGILLAPLPFAVTDAVFLKIDYYMTPTYVIGRIRLFGGVGLIIELVRKRKRRVSGA